MFEGLFRVALKANTTLQEVDVSQNDAEASLEALVEGIADIHLRTLRISFPVDPSDSATEKEQEDAEVGDGVALSAALDRLLPGLRGNKSLTNLVLVDEDSVPLVLRDGGEVQQLLASNRSAERQYTKTTEHVGKTAED